MIEFTKLSGTGNDFILFDNRNKRYSGTENEYFKKICQRRVAVGADGILLIENSEKFDFSLSYFNSDGSVGEMCGNGARSAAYFAFIEKIAPADMRFDVLGVPYQAKIENDGVSLFMPPPKEIKEYPEALEDPDFQEGGYLNVGVPHYVLFVKDVQRVDVEQAGRKYRFHKAFQPWGTNTNFVQLIDQDTIKIRTYERGVEEETLACGTGTISAAILAHKQKGIQLPVKVHALGGILRVNFADDLSRITLEGQVKITYQGELDETLYGL